MTGGRYTERELSVIREFGEHRTDAEIGVAIGRSAASVCFQRRKMGVLRGECGRLKALEVAFIELLGRVQELERGAQSNDCSRGGEISEWSSKIST